MSDPLVVYAIFTALLARPVAGHFAWWFSDRWHQTRPDGGDWFIAALAALTWPVSLALVVASRVVPRLFALMPAVGAERRALERRRQAERAEREFRNERLASALLDEESRP